ncbi:putative extracellular aldonolactonase protein [Lasiodiplodia theobromae]|uniref:Putative 6-phosphogluconolactonase n=1 Tax=Lasiodiplodia theobromae TaxID=45133 RepID=A0A5N5DP06_9PEZI|nr:Extracellular aldonolactonase protein [Lasiodiplodia theobromae]KAB2579669.1 putative 6-phosphogluconolactonase [Lasiodiplodia theobromae]KAF4542922.1 Extracellular aldonolactonase protein [Lasiodiplodia theobromae]KAF9633883.1 putative extracellular aldonolactonase protein [Lasiodiplodia theobromae]
MRHFNSLLLSTALGANAINLYAATSDGNVTSLSLTVGDSGNNLTVSSKTACGANASWLTFDSKTRLLYCLDRGVSSSTNGSMNSYSASADGVLTSIDSVTAPLSGVSHEVFTNEAGKRGFATASYNRSSISVIGLGEDGALDEPLQIIYPTLETTGPVTARQDRSYMHQVLVDPQGKYLVMNDLGGDRTRILKWDAENLAPLTELEPLRTDPGSGPRHGVFWKSPTSDDLFYFVVGELSQYVYTYKITYTDAGLTGTKIFEIPGLGFENEVPALTSPLSEIALSPDNKFLIVSHRDVSFANSTKTASGPSDTLSTFTINDDGTLDLLQLAPSGGWSPRHFALNKAGDLVAVGHQNNRTVVIWERNLETGKIVTAEEGGPVGIVQLSGAVVATIWDE